MDQAPPPQGSGTRRRVARTILAVDADRGGLNTLAHRLGRLGYLVVLADSGGQALELISARGFDLVLLDWALPDVSAFDVLREVRASRDIADLPVMVLSSESGPQAAVEAFAAGADDYLARPVDFEVLAARVERALARSARLEALKRSNLALDARIAARAIELGEARGELAAVRAERNRIAAAFNAQ